jgi:hypothetical protein
LPRSREALDRRKYDVQPGDRQQERKIPGVVDIEESELGVDESLRGREILVVGSESIDVIESITTPKRTELSRSSNLSTIESDFGRRAATASGAVSGSLPVFSSVSVLAILFLERTYS